MAVTVDKITNELTFFVNEAYGLAEALENEQVHIFLNIISHSALRGFQIPFQKHE